MFHLFNKDLHNSIDAEQNDSDRLEVDIEEKLNSFKNIISHLAIDRRDINKLFLLRQCTVHVYNNNCSKQFCIFYMNLRYCT